jgi:hypothetical protein
MRKKILASPRDQPKKYKKYVLLFISLWYFTTAIYINLPLNWARTLVLSVANLLPASYTESIKIGEYNLRKLAHITGSDNVWRMFSTPDKDFWTLLTVGRFKKNGVNTSQQIDVTETVTGNLPPPQSLILALNRQLLDNESLRQNYVDYLATRYKSSNLGTLERVSFVYKFQKLEPPLKTAIPKLSVKQNRALIGSYSPSTPR